MPIISREYESFLKTEQSSRKLSLYERLSEIADKFYPSVLMVKALEKPYVEAAEFSHLKIKSKGAFGLTMFVTTLIFIASLILLIPFNSLSTSSVLLALIMSSLGFYLLIMYPMHHATVFRISASAEMVLAAIYMGISMRLSPNLENAVRFASQNLKGPLAFDLRELLWGVYTRRYDRIEDAMDYFIKKWEHDNKEFTTSLYLIKNSTAESQSKRERYLDEAVSVMLDGTKERMKAYSRELKEPVVVLNALGILLPIIGLVFFPIVSIFLPDIIKPVMLVIGYNIFLPLIVYFMMGSYLEKRPYSIQQPDLSKHPDFKIEKFYEKPYTIPLIISLPLVVFAASRFAFAAAEKFQLDLLLYSMLAIGTLSVGVISYCYLSVRRKLRIRKEIAEIEAEYAEALFQLGSLLSRGIPLETSLRRTQEAIKNLKISKFFEKILYNIETFGMTLESATFDKQYGAINYYPSSVVEATMGVIVETSKKGMASSSKAMLIISKYLKDMHEVNEDLKDMMEEVTSSMSIQALILAPLSSGIVVTIYAVMARLSIALSGLLQNLSHTLSSSLGTAADIGGNVFDSIINIGSVMPVHYFQIIVGIYLVQIVAIISVSLSSINNGEETLLKRHDLAKTLGIGAVVYFITLLFTYFLFTSVISIDQLFQNIAG